MCGGGRPHTVPASLHQRDWYFIAEQPAPAPHLARPEGRAALTHVLIAVPRVSRSCELFPDGSDLLLLLLCTTLRKLYLTKKGAPLPRPLVEGPWLPPSPHPFRPYPEYSRANSYPWSPFLPEAGPSRTRSSHETLYTVEHGPST